MQDLYKNLPGQLTEFKDGGLQLRVDPNPPATDSILLLGTAIDGPINEPVAVDPATVELVFGRVTNVNGTPNGSTLVQGFEEAYAAGCRDIRLMRISGTVATATLNGRPAAQSVVLVKNEIFGALATGNTSSAFTLTETPDADSVRVYANNKLLAATAFTVVTRTVTIRPNECDSRATIVIEYTHNSGTMRSESGTLTNGILTPWIAGGADQVFDLVLGVNQVPIGPGAKLFANGVEILGAGFTMNVGARTVTLRPGFAPLNAVMSVSYMYQDNTAAVPDLKLNSIFGGDEYNNGQVGVEIETNQAGAPIGKIVVIHKPTSKRAYPGEAPLTYRTLEYPSYRLLVEAINNDPENNVYLASVAPQYENVASETLEVTALTSFVGGTSGIHLNKVELFAKLGGTFDAEGRLAEAGAYQLLENYNVDWIVPLGVHSDDVLIGNDNFAYQLAQACAIISHRNDITTGVITTRSPAQTTLAAVNTFVNDALDRKNDFFLTSRNGEPIYDSEGKRIDIGSYIRVIVGPDIVLRNTRIGMYATNSAAAYAGFVSSLAPKSAPFNKPVPGIVGLRYRLSNTQLNNLTAARYITYRMRTDGTIVIVDAMTAAQPGSDYAQETTMRIAKESANQVRSACDPFIGEPNETAQRNAMSAAIDKRLSRMKEAGSIVDYKFQVIASPMDQILGLARIELTIVPALTLRQLTTVVALRPSL